jgi:hypothetical protein
LWLKGKLKILLISAGLNQTLELSEMTRQQLEDEIQALNREKGDIQEQLSSVRYLYIE